MPLDWKHGDRAKLAQAAGISPQYLSDIINRRKNAPLKLAKKLVGAAHLLGYSLQLLDVLDPTESTNPLIGGGKRG